MKPELITTPNLEAGDDFYQALIDAHRGLSLEQSHQLNARLVLLLSNHIGAQVVLQAALVAARANLVPDGSSPSSASSPSSPSPASR